MTWTRTQQLRALMRLPWTVTSERNEDEGYLVARVAEIPDAIATGADPVSLGKELWTSLWSSLACRLEYGDDIPRPAGVTALPWEASSIAPARQRVPVGNGPAWEASQVPAGAMIGSI